MNLLAALTNVLAGIAKKFDFKNGVNFRITHAIQWTGFLNVSNYKWFSDKEIAGLDKELVAMLDRARGVAGVPFRLTATLATEGHSPNSAHYKGLAVDIGLGHLGEGFERNTQRWAILSGLFASGFKRIEICEKHIHVDRGTPPDYVSPTCWIGLDT